MQFNAFTIYFLISAFRHTNDIQVSTLTFMQLLFTILGFIVLTMGHLVALADRDSHFGVRTFVTAKSEATWAKCQRFGGQSLKATGMILLLFSFISDVITLLFSCLALLTLLVVLNLYYDYHTGKYSD